ncbi:MAG: DUF1730 domain-containing protein [Defluviitaleaceae bacterium]|nr:DUF1730 domain-containing protein [Defluviitaleaceae bacterium]MCL2275090.1 DUF1730 domain-containing protein [Defluviitaleaceae bacterium]
MRCLSPTEINNFAQNFGCIAGVCDAAPLARVPYAAGFTPFVSSDLEKRTNPTLTLKGAQSIIVIGVDREEKGTASINDTAFTAELSSLGTTLDYHKRVKAILLELVEALCKVGYTFRHKMIVDNAGLDERALAVRAGLGFYGRHGLVISQKFGTRFNIGCLLTDIPVEEIPTTNKLRGKSDASFIEECPHTCHLCIAACPTGALSFSMENPRGATFDVTRCISYLTQKDALCPEEQKLLGNQLYGCDLCQNACPRNAPRGTTYVNPADWPEKTDEDFAHEYGNTAMLWKGAEILRRNAKIVLHNLHQGEMLE